MRYKVRASSTPTTKIRNPSKPQEEDPTTILQYIRNKFAQLYKTKEFDEKAADSLIQGLPQLSLAQNMSLVKMISKEEILGVIDTLANNKASGTDSLSYEFYKLDIKVLAETLCKNASLTSLDLNSNNIGIRGIKALTEVLCKNISLQSLIIYDNALDLREVKTFQRLGGANAIAKIIFENTGLTSCNEFGSVGEILIAKALYKNTTLISLNLDSNYLGPEGAKVILESLCMNTTLKP
ncbi:hypothetical protein C2G38_2247151 [Gigaspora rosea]|uniref:Uncharacterized protein n=1 Tax=Gigaspora rosea TaxID=44941 RepID=A0A397V2V4_9GLOM|nr:hypothetical protein C2G38_2247151 [Gigaspora rosea]